MEIDQIKELSVSGLATTRDLAAASGNVAYVLGTFRPRLVIALAMVSLTNLASWGIGSSSQAFNICYIPASGYGWDASMLIQAFVDINNYQYAVIASINPTGVTLTWTKVLLPVGTLRLFLWGLK